ncbi:ComEC/Rec2 family competence protein [Kocuria sp.]|uniref:ComEC/Rec2 family competence protein n=1 Tax=Kocuria sp. TaxID=1871328 RepID=UPI0026DEFDF2|nr:ComEC/Rec2 family competence protein [Kocuria sp.]MDO5617680.1 ComEC/Rec2 family competence protein [Kocuria sp.]
MSRAGTRTLEAEHLRAAPRPTLDLRLVPAALTAWGSSLVLTAGWVGPNPQAPDLTGRMLVTVVLVVLGLGCSGALVGLVLGVLSTRLRRGRHRHIWRQLITGAVVCGSVATGVGAVSVHRQAEAAHAVAQLVGTPASDRSGHEPMANGGSAEGTADGRMARLEVEIVDRPVVWTASANTTPGSNRGTSSGDGGATPEWVQDRGEADGGVVVPVRTRDGLPATVFARDTGWRALRPGDVATAVVTVVTGPGGEVKFRAGSPPQVIGSVERGGLMSWLEVSKRRFMAGSSSLGADAASLLPGMTYGDRSGFDPALEQAMKDTGLTHLTAVSGSNCALVMILMGHLVLALGGSRRLCVLAGLLALVLFVTLVGPDPSVVRAAVMGGVAAAGILTGRGGTSLAALSVAVCGLLVVDPGWGRDFGFALSVCATAGIIITARPLIRILTTAMPQLVATMIAVPVVAQLWCAAVLTLLTPTVALWSVPANAVVAPVVPVITVIGLIALLCCGQPWAFGHLVGEIFLGVGQWPVWFVGSTARFFAGLPAAVLPWWEPPLGPMAMALMCAVAILVIHRVDARLSRRISAGTLQSASREESATGTGTGTGTATGSTQHGHTTRSPRGGHPALLYRRWPRVLAAAVVMGTVAVLAIGFWWKPAPRTDWVAVMCDVGQGDALLLRGTSGGESTTVLIDAGPDPAAVRKCLRQAHVTAVDLLILTHNHADHVAGAAGLNQYVDIGQVWWSSGTGRAPHEIAGWAVADQRPAPGAEFTGEGLRVEVLGPSGQPAAAVDSSGENNASLAIRVEVQGPPDFPTTTVLAAGDLENDGARTLLRTHGAGQGTALDVDVLKVSHHGARNGGTEIVDAASPALAMISVGARNTYGHPHPVITDHLAQRGTAVVRTDQMGTFGLYPQPESTALEIVPVP